MKSTVSSNPNDLDVLNLCHCFCYFRCFRCQFGADLKEDIEATEYEHKYISDKIKSLSESPHADAKYKEIMIDTNMKILAEVEKTMKNLSTINKTLLRHFTFLSLYDCF